jgi:hypothetical protein
LEIIPQVLIVFLVVKIAFAYYIGQLDLNQSHVAMVYAMFWMHFIITIAGVCDHQTILSNKMPTSCPTKITATSPSTLPSARARRSTTSPSSLEKLFVATRRWWAIGEIHDMRVKRILDTSNAARSSLRSLKGHFPDRLRPCLESIDKIANYMHGSYNAALHYKRPYAAHTLSAYVWTSNTSRPNLH